MTREAKRLTQDEFERLLETYGGDFDRWPEASRAPARELVARGATASRALSEARALDQTLARAPLPAASRLSPLSDRILAAAIAGAAKPAMEPSLGHRPTARVIPLPLRRPGGASPRVAPLGQQTPPSSPIPERVRWRAATALAASLVLGIALGVSDLAPTSVLGLVSFTEAQAGDAELVLSALQGNGLGGLDEDDI